MASGVEMGSQGGLGEPPLYVPWVGRILEAISWLLETFYTKGVGMLSPTAGPRLTA
jgi:hypothetical protein